MGKFVVKLQAKFKVGICQTMYQGSSVEYLRIKEKRKSQLSVFLLCPIYVRLFYSSKAIKVTAFLIM